VTYGGQNIQFMNLIAPYGVVSLLAWNKLTLLQAALALLGIGLVLYGSLGKP
jgi:hypothetical protein